MGRRPILLERDDVDLPAESAQSYYCALGEVRGVRSLVDPVSLHWDLPASTKRLPDGTCGCGPVWMAERTGACCFPAKGSTIKVKLELRR
jgi:hypothetical protein